MGHLLFQLQEVELGTPASVGLSWTDESRGGSAAVSVRAARRDAQDARRRCRLCSGHSYAVAVVSARSLARTRRARVRSMIIGCFGQPCEAWWNLFGAASEAKLVVRQPYGFALFLGQPYGNLAQKTDSG